MGVAANTTSAFQGQGVRGKCTGGQGAEGQGYGVRGHGSKHMQIPLHRWWKLPVALQGLSITPEESKKLDDLYQKVKEKLIDSKASLQKSMLKLEMQFDSDNFDHDQCLKIFKEAQETRTELALDKFGFTLQTRKILGKERFDKLFRNFKQFKHRASKKNRQQPGNNISNSAIKKGTTDDSVN